MTTLEKNLEGLIKALAEKKIGDVAFCKKYGIACEKAGEILKPYGNGKDPDEQTLDYANYIWVEQVSKELMNKIKKQEIKKDFFTELTN